MAVFESNYATGYDTLYREKDYVSECNFVEDIVQQCSGAIPHKILDIGCGTGGHAIELARRGYHVTGVDLSLSMIELASKKASDQLPGQSQPEFLQGDARTLTLASNNYDVVIMMFAVVGYLTTNEELIQAFSNAVKYLKPNGIFLCDFWWGPAVLTERPGDRVKLVPLEDGKLLRTTHTTVNTNNNIATVNFEVFNIPKNLPASQTCESHKMRYFFGPEMELLMKCGGLTLLNLTQFPEVDKQPTDHSWNVAAVAKKT